MIPTAEAIEERFKVPCISVTGSDVALGEWFCAFPKGSHTDEPIFWPTYWPRARMGAGYLVARRLDADGINSHLVDRFGEE